MKLKFSYEEHDQASNKLQKIRDYLVALTTEVEAAYPKNSKVAKQAKKSYESVDKLRFALMDELSEESPEQLEMGPADFYQRQNAYNGKASSDVDI